MVPRACSCKPADMAAVVPGPAMPSLRDLASTGWDGCRVRASPSSCASGFYRGPFSSLFKQPQLLLSLGSHQPITDAGSPLYSVNPTLRTPSPSQEPISDPPYLCLSLFQDGIFHTLLSTEVLCLLACCWTSPLILRPTRGDYGQLVLR